MDPVTLAYFAGVIEARAHIEINNRHERPQPRLRVTTRKVELLTWLAARTGTKVVEDHAGYHRRACAAHCTDQHMEVARQSAQWTADSARATIILYNIQPYVACRVDEVRHALLHGLQAFPPARGNSHKLMAKLGWAIPELTLPLFN